MSAFRLLFTMVASYACGAVGCDLMASEPCQIIVLDEENDWPVPLVELRTTHDVRFVTDNAGVVAFDLRELMGKETFFHIEGHGYSFPKDGFGFRGVRLIPKPGETLTVHVQRQQLAKRIGRLTGAGLFAESQKLGKELDWKDQEILGCDSVLMTRHRDQLFWAWGDTTLAKYPLGIFDTLGASTGFDSISQFQPPLKPRFNYFLDDKQQPRGICKMPGSGPTWMSGLVSIKDKHGHERLVGTYVKIQPPLTAYETGLCVWDKKQKQFQQHKILWRKSDQEPLPPPMPNGHPYFWADDAGTKWMFCGDPFPHLKCLATFEAWENPDLWTLITPQTQVEAEESDQSITPHRGSVTWNEYRKKWVSIFTQLNGKASHLGEIWYAEANSPTGPWKDAIQVATHENYTFYNPRIHPELTHEGSPILLFEGTYTKQFAKHAAATPRYNYNQILYRLDLNELKRPHE